MKAGICELCLHPGNLARSHAIPNALIRDIQRRNNGQTFLVNGRPPHWRRTNESGHDHLLCQTCESRLNTSFDSYGVSWIQQARQKIDNAHRPIRIQVDPQRMLGFVSSVLWRAAISTNHIYESINTDYAERLRLRSIFEDKADRYSLASMFIVNLYDKQNRFSPAALRDVVIAPTSWRANSAGVSLRAFFFVANGLLFNLTMPPPTKSVGKGKFWTADTINPIIQSQDIRAFPPLQWMLGFEVKKGV